MKKRIWKEVAATLLFLLTALLCIAMVSHALKPARSLYGAVWEAYLAEEPNSMDYLYLGSSYTYCDISPAAIEEETGLVGYCMAGPEQTMGITYWYLRECLKTQKPRVVLIEGTSLHFKEYQDFTQVNLAYMPMGVNRIAAAFTTAEPELRTGLLFDLYFYHDRWSSIPLSEAVRALLPTPPSELRGFTPVEGNAQSMDGAPYTREPQPEEVYLENLAWLERIVTLCGKRGITPVVIFHPTYSRLPDEVHDRIREDVAAMEDVLYFDLSRETETLGLDPMTDYYDEGHLNAPAAQRFSTWLGGFMGENIPALTAGSES